MITHLSKLLLHMLCPVVCLLPACSTIKNISIEVLVPPDTTIFTGSHSASIIYRSGIIPQSDSLFKVIPDTLLLDKSSRIVLFEECVRGAHEILELSPELERVITDTLVHELPFSDSIKVNDTPDWSFVEEIGERNRTDIVISLDRIHAWDSLFRSWVYETQDFGSAWVQRYENHMLIGLAAQWTIYNVQEKTIMDHYIYIDTVVWSVPYQVVPSVANRLPQKENAFLEAFYWAGNGYGRRIVSAWEETERMYFCANNELMKQACLAAKNNNWRKAAEHWKKLTEHKNKSLAAKAAYNMALVCEIEDKLELALNWAVTSYFLKKSDAAKNYIDILSVRRYVKRRMQSEKEPK